MTVLLDKGAKRFDVNFRGQALDVLVNDDPRCLEIALGTATWRFHELAYCSITEAEQVVVAIQATIDEAKGKVTA